jgi:hypothetical protein
MSTMRSCGGGAAVERRSRETPQSSRSCHIGGYEYGLGSRLRASQKRSPCVINSSKRPAMAIQPRHLPYTPKKQSAARSMSLYGTVRATITSQLSSFRSRIQRCLDCVLARRPHCGTATTKSVHFICMSVLVRHGPLQFFSPMK